jgi:hypothetical protein
VHGHTAPAALPPGPPVESRRSDRLLDLSGAGVERSCWAGVAADQFRNLGALSFRSHSAGIPREGGNRGHAVVDDDNPQAGVFPVQRHISLSRGFTAASQRQFYDI